MPNYTCSCLTDLVSNKPQAVAWSAQPGSQQAFLSCPVFEVLLHGNRGGGKTDSLIMDFAQHCGQGWGADWRGILFRRTYPELQDVIGKTLKWFPRIWPRAKYNRAQHVWTWPGGEMLFFRHMMNPADYLHYHGHAYPWIGWEELTNWPDDKCLRSMMSCCRSTRAGIPKKVRATTNPYGKGHNWVKLRYNLPAGGLICPSEEPQRIAIRSMLLENRALLAADPDYMQRIAAAAANKHQLAAWREGSWDIVSGGMFDDVWAPDVHVLPSFPLKLVPKRWKVDRSFDWGSAKPFAVGWWAESNGEPFEWAGMRYGAIKGDKIRIAEWYGWTGAPNEGLRMSAHMIAGGIINREAEFDLGTRVKPGVADTSIFDDYQPGRSVAGDMAKAGVTWLKADKGPGSRKQGWLQIRKLLRDAAPDAYWPRGPEHGANVVLSPVRERPGLFVLDRCDQFLRTFPVLPRDEKDPDDVDTETEDHIADETRYRCRAGSGVQFRDAA